MEEPPAPPSFSCPHCGAVSDTFRNICPSCGRPYIRDYVDVRVHPRDSDLTGTFAFRKKWARVSLVLIMLAVILTVLMVLLF
jgi:predicted amidophosphoribosyltransferase